MLQNNQLRDIEIARSLASKQKIFLQSIRFDNTKLESAFVISYSVNTGLKEISSQYV